MNRYAYRLTGLAIKAVSEITKARIAINGREHIPKGAVIFAVNHFTRIETAFLPYHIFKITNIPVWSLADYNLFKGAFGSFLEKTGAVSTQDPDRDLLIVKSLLTGEASWIIFPEGRMVKSKKIYERGHQKGSFRISSPSGSHRPHTGAATLALRTEFYRERIRAMGDISPGEARRLMDLYKIDSINSVLDTSTFIVPVNVTYYPIRAKENILSNMASGLISDIPARIKEEVMTEGTMLLSGVDIDIRFGEPIKISQYMKSPTIRKDILTTDLVNFDDPIPSKRILQMSSMQIMERYMSSIYGMTTVNHDHLFASILRNMEHNEIDELDFKRKVFLATGIKPKKTLIFRNKALDKNQIHLLTDDRYKKYKNFITLAAEKGIIEKKDDTLVKGPFFSAFEDFHRARIDNPVAVIANEIEPLTELQDKFTDLAKQPALRIKYKLLNHLMEKVSYDFHKDYAKYYIDDESKPKNIGRPYLLKGTSNNIGIVLIHGYMSAPREPRELAIHLNKLGYWVYVPRLKGHGTSADDLAKRRYMDWVDSVDEGYVIMRNTCKKIIAGGFSTGAGLALNLSSRVNDIAGVFAVAPPFKLQDFNTRFIPMVMLWNWLMKKLNLDAFTKEFVRNSPENPHINYLRNPLAGVLELKRLMESIEPKLAKVNTPVLIIQSLRDPVVNPAGSRKVFKTISSEDKEYLLLNYSRHGIIHGDGAERVFSAIENFIKRLQ